MGADRKIINALRQATGKDLSDDTAGIVIASVDSVDLDNLTCDCTAISGVAVGGIPGVLLMAEVDDGFLIVPEIDSVVIIQYSAKQVPYIAMFSQVSQIIMDAGNSQLSLQDDLIQFNDGTNGGLTNTPELRTQLNKTNDLLNAILSVLTGAPIPEPGNNSPSALQQALAAAIAGKSLGTFNKIEDSKITH